MMMGKLYPWKNMELHKLQNRVVLHNLTIRNETEENEWTALKFLRICFPLIFP